VGPKTLIIEDATGKMIEIGAPTLQRAKAERI